MTATTLSILIDSKFFEPVSYFITHESTNTNCFDAAYCYPTSINASTGSEVTFALIIFRGHSQHIKFCSIVIVNIITLILVRLLRPIWLTFAFAVLRSLSQRTDSCRIAITVITVAIMIFVVPSLVSSILVRIISVVYNRVRRNSSTRNSRSNSRSRGYRSSSVSVRCYTL